MATQINAYLNFDGNCREAMTFYQSCIGGELNFQMVGESPVADQLPQEMQAKVMHVALTKGELVLMASDMLAAQGLVRGNDISLSLNCSSEEEIRTFYEKLASGGEILEELKEQFWGALFGYIKDKFGVRWMLNYDKK